VHEHGIALDDAVESARSDRGVPRRDREGEVASADLRNGDPELGDLMYRKEGFSTGSYTWRLGRLIEAAN
jgi:hypothetical protein